MVVLGPRLSPGIRMNPRVWDLSQSAMDSFCAIWRKGLTPTQACLEFAT